MSVSTRTPAKRMRRAILLALLVAAPGAREHVWAVTYVVDQATGSNLKSLGFDLPVTIDSEMFFR